MLKIFAKYSKKAWGVRYLFGSCRYIYEYLNRIIGAGGGSPHAG